MVWENKMHTIVMVTRCEEAGKVFLELKSTTFTFADLRLWCMVSFNESAMHCIYNYTVKNALTHVHIYMHIIICRPSVSSTGPRSCMTASLQETSSV